MLTIYRYAFIYFLFWTKKGLKLDAIIKLYLLLYYKPFAESTNRICSEQGYKVSLSLNPNVKWKREKFLVTFFPLPAFIRSSREWWFKLHTTVTATIELDNIDFYFVSLHWSCNYNIVCYALHTRVVYKS